MPKIPVIRAAQLKQDVGDFGLERQLRVDGPQALVERPGVEELLDGGLEQRILVGEHAKDGALGDARRLGDLAGGHFAALLDQQRDDGVDDHRATIIRRQRFGAGARLLVDPGHDSTLSE